MKGFKTESRHYVLIVALLLALYASYLLVAPYIGAIVLAFVLSLLCFPVHQYIELKLPGRPNLVASISCLLLVVVILVPASLVFMAIVQQGVAFTKQSYSWLNDGGATHLLQHPLLQSALDKVNRVLPTEQISGESIVQQLTEFASGFGKELLNLSTKLVGDVTGLLFSFILMLFILFFLLRDHEKVVNTLHWVLPLSRSQEVALLDEAKKVARSAVMGAESCAMTAAQGLKLQSQQSEGRDIWVGSFAGCFRAW